MIEEDDRMKLENKVAIVTGGSTGIGYSIVEAYLKEGAKVVIASYDLDEVNEAVNKLALTYDKDNILGAICDVKKLDDVKKTIKDTISKFGKIDILVNNAGITNAKPTESVTDEDFLNMFEVNTFGPFRFIREVIPYMKENGGSIINTSSMVGTYASPMQAGYSASKSAVNGLTKSCARELGAYNIRVNAVAPGAVMTNMVRGAVTDEQQAMLSKVCPLGRIANPDELAGVYVYLASNDASFTTGAVINVDGGIVM